MTTDIHASIAQLELEIGQKLEALHALRKQAPSTPVPNYTFQTATGPVTLLELFGDRDLLFVIHNMGQGCRYCTLWADGLNAWLPHLESRYAVVLVSRDPPTVQRRFANARGWRFSMASHGGGPYIVEQGVMPGYDNAPGLVCYERRGDQVLRKNATPFGPGDTFAAIWHVLSLGGVGTGDWVPQFTYWKPPATLDDGGQGVE